jgi:hypothetical protein
MYVGFKSYKPMIYLYVDICLQSFPNFFNVIYWYGNRYYYIESFYSHTCPCSHLYSAVICIKMSHFSLAVIENFIWIEPLLRGNLFYKATVSLFQWWPLNTGLTVHWSILENIQKKMSIFIQFLMFTCL